MMPDIGRWTRPFTSAEEMRYGAREVVTLATARRYDPTQDEKARKYKSRR